MKNKIVEYIRSTYVLKITGKHPENFIRKLISNRVELLEIKRISRHEIHIKIYKNDYETVLECKSIYEIETIELHGAIRVKKMMKVHKILLIMMLLGLVLLYGLSCVISEVEIVHTNKEIRDLIYDEFKTYGIEKNHIKKSYKKIQEIKDEIVYRHKDKIEWLEIENIGTKYIVRVEIRKLKGKEMIPENRDIVAKKDAIIKKIEAKNGMTVKKINDYVIKGDTVITGNIALNEEIKNMIAAEGTIYGEVWYKVRVTYPLAYYEEKTTGRKNSVYTFTFLNKRIELFNKTPYKNKKIKKKILLKNNLLPISFQKEEQTEINKIEQILMVDEAVLKAEEEARLKIKKNLNEKEYIINEKKLKVNEKDSRIVLEMFFTVYEDITDYKKIEEPPALEKEE